MEDHRGLYLRDGYTVPDSTNRYNTGDRDLNKQKANIIYEPVHERENFSASINTENKKESYFTDNNMIIVLGLILIYLVFMVSKLSNEMYELKVMLRHGVMREGIKTV